MKLESELSAEVHVLSSTITRQACSLSLVWEVLHSPYTPSLSHPQAGVVWEWDQLHYTGTTGNTLVFKTKHFCRGREYCMWSGLGANGCLIIASWVWNPRQWIQLRTLGRLSVYWVLSLQVYTDPQYSVCSMEGECMLVYIWMGVPRPLEV